MNITISIIGSIIESYAWQLDAETGKTWFNRTGDVIRQHIDEIDLPQNPFWQVSGAQIRMNNTVIVENAKTGNQLDRFEVIEIDGQSSAKPYPLPKDEYFLFKTTWKQGFVDYRFAGVERYSRDLLAFDGVGIGNERGLGVTTSIRLDGDEQYPDAVYGRQTDWDWWID